MLLLEFQQQLQVVRGAILQGNAGAAPSHGGEACATDGAALQLLRAPEAECVAARRDQSLFTPVLGD